MYEAMNATCLFILFTHPTTTTAHPTQPPTPTLGLQCAHGNADGDLESGLNATFGWIHACSVSARCVMIYWRISNGGFGSCRLQDQLGVEIRSLIGRFVRLLSLDEQRRGAKNTHDLVQDAHGNGT